MFNMNLGLHIIEFPSKRFGFVGNIPLVLGEMVEPTKADVMAGRIIYDKNGDGWTVKFPSFETRDAAVVYLKSMFPKVTDMGDAGFDLHLTA